MQTTYSLVGGGGVRGVAGGRGAVHWVLLFPVEEAMVSICKSISVFLIYKCLCLFDFSLGPVATSEGSLINNVLNKIFMNICSFLYL